MTIKVTWFIQHETGSPGAGSRGKRIAGFSESWYYAGDNPQSALNALEAAGAGIADILSVRSQLLPANSAVVGARAITVGLPGGTVAREYLRIGKGEATPDIPQMALLCRANGAGVPNHKLFSLRGVPDEMVRNGEYGGSREYDVALRNFFRQLARWQIRCVDTTQPIANVLSMAADGTMILDAPIAAPAGDVVNVLRVTVEGNRQRGGIFTVASVDATQLVVKVTGWKYGAGEGGKARKHRIKFVNVAEKREAGGVTDGDVRVLRAVPRKVGRPLSEYRGRNSHRGR